MVAIVLLLNVLMGYTVSSAAIAMGISLALVTVMLPAMDFYQDKVLEYGDERIRMLREVLLVR